MPPKSGTSRFGKAAQIRRAERTLQKDLRFMVRRNQERRDNRTKGAGGLKLPNEFPQLRRAKLDVSIEATALVKKEFGTLAALPFAFRTAFRQLAYDLVPDRVAQFIGASGGRKSQSEHDEGGQEQRQQRSQQNQHGAGRASATSAGRAIPAEGPSLDRTLYVAKAVDALAAEIPDLQRWLRSEPEALNRTRDLFSVADRVAAATYSPASYGTGPQHYGPTPDGTDPQNYGPASTPERPTNVEVANVARSARTGRTYDMPPPTPFTIARKPAPAIKTVPKRS